MELPDFVAAGLEGEVDDELEDWPAGGLASGIGSAFGTVVV